MRLKLSEGEAHRTGLAYIVSVREGLNEYSIKVFIIDDTVPAIGRSLIASHPRFHQ
jgi:hypothetical protein